MAEANDPLAGLPTPSQAQQKFSDPKFLQAVAELAAQHNQPQVMQWLERAHIAAKEGAFEAAGKLMAGDVQGAVDLWNQTGQFRDVTAVNRNKDGSYAISRKDGSSVTIDPVNEYKRFLSPRDFLAFQDAERNRAALAEDRKLTRQQWKMQFDEQKRYHDAQIARWDDDRALREAQAIARGSGTGSRSGGGDGLKPAEMVKAYEEARKEAKELADTSGEGVDALAQTLFWQKTARVVRDPKTNEYAIEVGTPRGKYDEVARYDSKADASAAYAELMDRRMRPKQGELTRTSQIGRWKEAGSPSANLRAVEQGMAGASAAEQAKADQSVAQRMGPPRPSRFLPADARFSLNAGGGGVPMPAAAPRAAVQTDPAPPPAALTRMLPSAPAMPSSDAYAQGTYRAEKAYEDTPDGVRQRIAEITSIISDVQKGRRKLPAGEVKRLHDELRAAAARLKAMGAE